MGRANDFLNGFTRDEIIENGQGTQLAIDETKQPEETAQPVANNVQSQGYNMTDFYKSINPNPELTPEQQAKMARRERASKAIAALGDVGTAMANIWTTRNGATPIEQNPTLSNVEANRWEKWKQEHKQKVDQYRQGLGQARQLDVTNILADRKQKTLEGREQRLWEKQQNTQEMNQARADLYRSQEQLNIARANGQDKLAELYENRINEVAERIKKLQSERKWIEDGKPYSPQHFNPNSGRSGSSSSKGYTIGGKYFENATKASTWLQINHPDVYDKISGEILGSGRIPNDAQIAEYAVQSGWVTSSNQSGNAGGGSNGKSNNNNWLHKKKK